MQRFYNLFDRVQDETLMLGKLRSSIEDIEPFKNDEHIQLVSDEILELTNKIRLKCNGFN